MITHWLKYYFCILVILLFYTPLHASNDSISSPIEIIVGFGPGGSTDTLARSMAPYLSEALDIQVNVRNIPGRGSALAIETFLDVPLEKNTILCSAFSPFIPAAIIQKNVEFTMKDLDFLNIQWYGYDLIAVYGKLKIKSLVDLLLSIKNSTKKFKVAVVENSNGYLLLRFLLKEMNISMDKIDLHKYNSGGDARKAISNGDVDVIMISSKRSEFIRQYITPLAIYSNNRQAEWDIPTVNEALSSLGIKIPLVPGYMRGFALNAAYKKKYPERYKIIEDAFKLIMAKKSVQRALKKNKVGGTWTGPEKSTKILNETNKIFKKYQYLIKP
ncbi:tripartite tricarboxylate transporter substrate-binding protein [Sulfurospirillum arcachonense]|uniref:tripartite tricarboxylate transporter substrate-binding protein n=1 Tax=Sulfurospirillum arcachonense TaxID=57666 RepID=UPI0004698446|nr:tripartite tricarboxylate transporter substrate-binding protein [Sulfurospirillum arcachonense]